MSIRINKERCVGCGKCADICPGTLIAVRNHKAEMDYPRDCWGCVSCVKECPADAIDFFLGADIGGDGSVMNVTAKGDISRWKVTRRDGSVVTIDVDRRNANQY